MIKQAADTSLRQQEDHNEQNSLFNESITSTARSCRSLASIPYVDTQRETKQLKRVLRKAQRSDPRVHGLRSPAGHIARVYTPSTSRRVSRGTTPYKYGLTSHDLKTFGKFDMSNLPPWNSYFMRSRPMSPKEKRMQLLDYEEKPLLPSFSPYIGSAPSVDTEPTSSRSRDRTPRRSTRRPSAVTRLSAEEMNLWTKQLHILVKQSLGVCVSDLVELSTFQHPPSCVTDYIVYLSVCIGGSDQWPEAKKIVFQDINMLFAFIKSVRMYFLAYFLC